MKSPCEVVAERLALAEPLAELSQHVEDCPRCQSLRATELKLTAARREATPALGFTSRMTVIATQRLMVRQRRRVVGYAAVSALAASVLTLSVVRQTSSTDQATQAAALPAAQVQPAGDPWSDRPTPDAVGALQTDDGAEVSQQEDQDDLRDLLDLSRTHADPVSADWAEIEAPLSPYDRLLQQVGN